LFTVDGRASMRKRRCVLPALNASGAKNVYELVLGTAADWWSAKMKLTM